MEKIINDKEVNLVKERMPDENSLINTAELFKVFGDSTRIRIISALIESELCVNDLAVVLAMNQSAVSHQLRILKTAHLVKTRRDGRVIYYSLDDDHIKIIFNAGLEHILEE